MIYNRHLTLNDVFPEWHSEGIFTYFSDVPWSGKVNSQNLNLLYHGMRSGQKRISPLVRHFSDINNPLLASDKSVLASTIEQYNTERWSKLWATLELTYNPIENYSLTETMANDVTTRDYGKTQTRTDDLTHTSIGVDTTTPNLTDTTTNDLTNSKTSNETLTPNLTDTRTDNTESTTTTTGTTTPNITETTTPNITTNTDNGIYGFNSADSVPTGKQTQTASGTSTLARTGTESNEATSTQKNIGTVTTTKAGTETREGTETDKTTGTQTIEHKGSEIRDTDITDTDTGTQKYTDGGTDTESRSYELKRSGNIGVTTSQQMLESERNLWVWNFFRDVVFPDIDSVLVLGIY